MDRNRAAQGAAFRAMTPSEHLERAKSALKGKPSDDAIADALGDLEAIPPDSSAAAEGKIVQGNLIAERQKLRLESDRSSTAGNRPDRSSTAGTPGAFRVGETARIASSNGYWACGSSQQALDEMLKWAGLHDEAEVKRTMVRTRSVGLTEGLRVKILDAGGLLFSEKKVRVTASSEGKVYDKDEQGTFLADPRIGKECWIVNEALTR